MPIQKRIAFFGISKQTAKGAAAAAATFGLGTLGGSLLVVGIDQESDQITYSGTQRISPDENRLGINPGAGVRTRAYPRSIGLLLFGSLGAIATTGVGPYSHVITPAATLPYLTAFTKLGTSEYARVPDCKVDSLRLSWSERSPLEIEATLLAISAELGAAAWTITNDESAQPKFAPPGGTFKVDAAAGTPIVAKITGGEITIANAISGITLSASLYPDDVYEGEHTFDVSLTLMPDDFAEWRKAVTGTGTGTAPANVPIFGSFETKFQIDANTHLTLAASRVAFFPDFPDADPGGGPVELVLPGRAKQPATGNAFTATLSNFVVSY